MHTEVLAGSHLTIFYPLPYFRTEPLNQVLHEDFDGTKYQDWSYHWIPLSQIFKPGFNENFISSFNYQIICYMAERVVTGLQSS